MAKLQKIDILADNNDAISRWKQYTTIKPEEHPALKSDKVTSGSLHRKGTNFRPDASKFAKTTNIKSSGVSQTNVNSAGLTREFSKQPDIKPSPSIQPSAKTPELKSILKKTSSFVSDNTHIPFSATPTTQEVVSTYEHISEYGDSVILRSNTTLPPPKIQIKPQDVAPGKGRIKDTQVSVQKNTPTNEENIKTVRDAAHSPTMNNAHYPITKGYDDGDQYVNAAYVKNPQINNNSPGEYESLYEYISCNVSVEKYQKLDIFNSKISINISDVNGNVHSSTIAINSGRIEWELYRMCIISNIDIHQIPHIRHTLFSAIKNSIADLNS